MGWGGGGSRKKRVVAGFRGMGMGGGGTSGRRGAGAEAMGMENGGGPALAAGASRRRWLEEGGEGRGKRGKGRRLAGGAAAEVRCGSQLGSNSVVSGERSMRRFLGLGFSARILK